MPYQGRKMKKSCLNRFFYMAWIAGFSPCLAEPPQSSELTASKAPISSTGKDFKADQKNPLPLKKEAALPGKEDQRISSTGKDFKADQKNPLPLKKEAALPGKEAEDDDSIYDPLEDWNRSVFAFNQMLNFIFWDPLAEAYQFIVPDFVQKSVRNLLSHISIPISLVNDIFQFNADKFSTHFVRLLINTGFGLGGLVDVAGMVGVSIEREDFGKTLKNVGVGPGAFVMIPILGPANTRDSLGRIADALFLWPVGYANSILVPQYCTEYLNGYLDYRDSLTHVHENFSDPYVIVRNLYAQIRGDIDPESFSQEKEDIEDKEADVEGGSASTETKEKIEKAAKNLQKKEKEAESGSKEQSLWDGMDFPESSAQDEETVISLSHEPDNDELLFPGINDANETVFQEDAL
jgi:phospholipid-binding lipoprotein MlaA